MDIYRYYPGVKLDPTNRIYEINDFLNIYGCIKKEENKILFNDIDIIKVYDVLTIDNYENFAEINIKKIMDLNNIYIHELRHSKKDNLYYYYKCNIYNDKVDYFLKEIINNKQEQLEYPLILTISLLKNNLLKCKDFKSYFPKIVYRIYNFCIDNLAKVLSKREIIKKYKNNNKKFNDHEPMEKYIASILKLIEYEKNNKYKTILIMILMIIISNHLTNKIILNNKVLNLTILKKLEMLVDNLEFIDWNNIEHL